MAILFDVGGTLWPDATREPGVGLEVRYSGTAHELAAARLEERGVDPSRAVGLATALADDAADRMGPRQDTLGHVRRVLHAAGAQLDPTEALDAMCVPARHVLDPFPGALDLLRDLEHQGHRLALVSNTQWRSAARFRQDFATWHADGLFDAYVTSLDVGFRKPHPAMFHHALDALGVTPADAVMVGDSPTKDIAPAKELGMRAVLVVFQTAIPADTRGADHVVTTIGELRQVLIGEA